MYDHVTGQRYYKANRNIDQILNKYWDGKKAVEITDNRCQSYLRNEIPKTSQLSPYMTVRHLVDENRIKTK